MKRVLLIGAGGAGKSTLARRLSAKTGLPLVHLDALYWQPGWVEMPEPQWRDTVARLVQAPEWIMDGNYGGTLEARLAACDTIVLLDLPPWVCLSRVIGRRLAHAGRSRAELPAGCPERLDAGFLWWIATYRRKRLPGVMALLDGQACAGKRVIVLRSASQVEAFLADAG